MFSNSKAAAIPANSDTTRPRLAAMRQTTAKRPRRRLNCSRMSETSPSPVWTPSRADISCTTTSATVTSSMTKRVRYTNWDPADA